MKRLLAVTCIFLSFLLLSQIAGAAVPKVINYQGSLLDSAGNPLSTSDYTLTFRIYDGPTSTNLIWGPQVFDGATTTGHGAQVPVVQGYFNVILGPVDTAGRTLYGTFDGPTGENRYLEVTVGSGQPILPRQQILSAPYAISAAGSVPVGSIVPFGGNTANIPSNWRLCNGALISDPESPLNNTNTPNLSGRFLRGADASYPLNYYAGADTHTHGFYDNDPYVYFARNTVGSWYGWQMASQATAFFPNIYAPTVDNSTNTTGPWDSHGHINGSTYASGTTYAGSTLPRFYSVNYIMRIK